MSTAATPDTTRINSLPAPLIGAGAALFSFLLYLFTVPPSITWQHGGQDSGNLAVAVHYLGIPHPTGYPTYVLVGKLFEQIPIGDLAYRLNIMSAVFAAGTIFLVFFLIRAVAQILIGLSDTWSTVGAATGVLFLAVSPLFWSQAIITEVYALNIFFAALILFLIVKWRSSGESRYLALSALSLGIGLGNHVTLLAILPAAAGLASACGKARRVTVKPLVWPVLLFVAGLSVYALLPLRAAATYANWGNPSSLDGFLYLVTGGEYRYLLTSLSVPQIANRILGAVGLVLEQFAPWGFILGIIGIWISLRQAKWLAAGLATSTAIVVVYASIYAAENAEVYLLPMYLVFTIWLGIGAGGVLQLLSSRISQSTQAPNQASSRAWLALPAAILLILPVAYGIINFGEISLSSDTQAIDSARSSLESLPTGAILLTSTDQETFGMEYTQQVLEVRPDVAITDTRLVGRNWYSSRQSSAYSQVVFPHSSSGSDSAVMSFLEANKGYPNVFSTSYDPALLTEFYLEPDGSLFRVTAK